MLVSFCTCVIVNKKHCSQYSRNVVLIIKWKQIIEERIDSEFLKIDLYKAILLSVPRFYDLNNLLVGENTKQ